VLSTNDAFVVGAIDRWGEDGGN